MDDDENALDLFAEKFRIEMECEVITSTDGAEAFALVCNGDFDLIISDLERPKHDGRWMLALLMARGEGPPLVFFTNSIVSRDLLLREGAAWVFRKNMDDLRLLLSKLAGK